MPPTGDWSETTTYGPLTVEFTTNLDSCRLAQFPTEVIAVPRVGERVRAISPTHIRMRDGTAKTVPQLELYVAGVVYGMRKVRINKPTYTGSRVTVPVDVMVPYVEVELHHPHAIDLGYM